STPSLTISETDVAAWITARVKLEHGDEAVGMGKLEQAVDQVTREARRQALETLVQQQASAQPLDCPVCKQRLNVEAYGRERRVNSSFGWVSFRRDYGFCVPCGKHTYPTDIAFGLHPRATASPRVQELAALHALRGPTAQHAQDFRRMTGLSLDPSTVHREARRQGERAQRIRDAEATLAQKPQGIAKLAAETPVRNREHALVIEIDAWNIRERDDWGHSKRLRRRGQEPKRWHWVYTATIFRLDQRATTASGRPIIAERGFVATRLGLDTFRHQLYAEALRRGLTSAKQVLVVADGAIWIWNLVEDRFKDAQQRVDLYHVKGHLWSLANELFGRGTVEARAWVTPLLQALDRRNNGALDVIHGLEGMRSVIDKLTTEQREALEREIGYFNTHKDRMDYKQGKRIGQPVGSGAIESTCSQYQRRFKLTGQFWSLSGDEAFLALATLHRNGRWQQLFPHDSRAGP
ncbi:MAG: ISKra4 family transposase, partial [Lentisphaeria bacterium]|nr:ISKra4 family transposase [Lentisphaeria bacterium]